MIQPLHSKSNVLFMQPLWMSWNLLCRMGNTVLQCLGSLLRLQKKAL